MYISVCVCVFFIEKLYNSNRFLIIFLLCQNWENFTFTFKMIIHLPSLLLDINHLLVPHWAIFMFLKNKSPLMLTIYIFTSFILSLFKKKTLVQYQGENSANNMRIIIIYITPVAINQTVHHFCSIPLRCVSFIITVFRKSLNRKYNYKIYILT